MHRRRPAMGRTLVRDAFEPRIWTGSRFARFLPCRLIFPVWRNPATDRPISRGQLIAIDFVDRRRSVVTRKNYDNSGFTFDPATFLEELRSKIEIEAEAEVEIERKVVVIGDWYYSINFKFNYSSQVSSRSL